MQILRGKRLAGAGVALACVAALAIALLQPGVQKIAVAKILGMATGTTVSFADVSFHRGHATLAGVTVSDRGKPLARIPRVDVRYSLGDLLPGSAHLYGVHALTIYRPRITVVRLPDGTYNLPKFATGRGPAHARAPMNLTFAVIGGTLTVTDETRVDPASRTIRIGTIDINAGVHTNGITRYRASMAYLEGGAAYPIRGAAVIDSAAGYTLHHWTAARLPLAQVVNYELNNANLRMQSGFLVNLDARYYGTISASAYMSGARVAMAGMPAPIANIHGPLDVTGAGLTTSGITATVAGAPVNIAGGIYDLRKPQFRLTVAAANDVGRLKLMSAAAAKLPVRGPVRISMLVEGPVRAPVAFIALRSPQFFYARMPLRDASGTIAFDGATAQIVNFGLRYGGFRAGLRGRMSLRNGRNALEALAQLSGPSAGVPFASAVLPPMDLRGTLAARGDTLRRFDTQGEIRGSGSGTALASTFSLFSNGMGRIALTLGNRLDARIAIERPRNRIAALVHAQRMRIATANAASLPGLNLKALPAVRGTISGDVFAMKQGTLLGLAGSVHLSNAAFGAVSIAGANARFSGSPGAIGVQALEARGSFGTLNAHGAISGTNEIALAGHLHGSLAALGVPLGGNVDAPVALIYDKGRAIAQIDNARFSGTQIRGIGLDRVSATVAARGKQMHVYAAHARLSPNGDAVASGSLGTNGANLALAVADLSVMGGSADVGATASGSLRAPQIRGAAVVQNLHAGRYPVSGGTAFAYGGNALHVDNALLGVGPAYVTVDGNVGGLAMGAPFHPVYDLRAGTRAADVHELAALASPALARRYLEGSVDATVLVTGSGSAPVIAGTLDAPEGSINGLGFRNLRATIAGTPQSLRIGNGSVTVGETVVAFSAALAGKNVSGSIDAPHADLEDFNDYFDAGDTFAGGGRLALRITHTPDSFASSGDVALHGVRYHRYDVGTANARWSTRGRTLTARAEVGGTHGRAYLAGSVILPAAASPGSLVTNSTLDVRGTLRGLDLGTWLPLLGYRAPVTGTIDADASASGRYPDLNLGMSATLLHATVGRIPVEQAQMDLAATRGRGVVRRMIVRIPYLTAQGSGTFGFHAGDALALAVRASSPDIGKLMTTASGKTNAASGTLDTSLSISGTRADPQMGGRISLTAFRYKRFSVPKIWALAEGNARAVTLQHGEVDFTRGSVVASGTVPLRSRKNAPVALAMQVRNVDFSDFESALPRGYRLAGTMAGTMRVAGTMDDPLFDGSITLSNGYFVGPIDQNPVQHVNGLLAFAGNSIAIRNLHANVGAGTMAVNGTAVVPNFRDPKAATFSARIVANGAQINSPQYFRGKVDANVVASRAGGSAIPQITGSVAVPSARIPLTAFWNPHAPKSAPKAPLPLGFDLTATAGNDVRVQSNGVDVGATGRVTVGGTLASPTLAGAMHSTGGTVDFLRRFTIERAAVRFDPSNGIMPYVDATATTQVSNPIADIALHVTGLAPNNMQLSFDSEPSGYSKAQILAMLSGLTNLNGTGGSTQFSASNEIQNLAMGEVNTLFTQQLLEPLSASLGNALGLQNLQLTDDFTSGFGVSAVKAFGKHITAVFAENLGTPSRRSLSLEVHHGPSTAFDLTMYSVDTPPAFGYTPGTNPFNFTSSMNSSALMSPLLGTNGFTMTYRHEFQ